VYFVARELHQFNGVLAMRAEDMHDEGLRMRSQQDSRADRSLGQWVSCDMLSPLPNSGRFSGN